MPELAGAAQMRDAAVLLGFDYGEKRIGVALGNALTGVARALDIIDNRSRDYRFDVIGRLIADWQPTRLVVGLPSHPDGQPHQMTQLARRFGNQLNARFQLPVIWVDERYSSVDARAQRHHQLDEWSAFDGGKASLPRKRSASQAMSNPIGRAPWAGPAIDADAARVILQQYLDESSHV